MLQSMLIDQLEAELPPIIVRAKVDKLTGGLVSPKTLSNADTLGVGPREKEKVGEEEHDYYAGGFFFG